MLVTDGLVERGGGFVPPGVLDARVVMERFRRLLLRRLQRVERLSARFLEALLAWRQDGHPAMAVSSRCSALTRGV